MITQIQRKGNKILFPLSQPFSASHVSIETQNDTSIATLHQDGKISFLNPRITNNTFWHVNHKLDARCSFLENQYFREKLHKTIIPMAAFITAVAATDPTSVYGCQRYSKEVTDRFSTHNSLARVSHPALYQPSADGMFANMQNAHRIRDAEKRYAEIKTAIASQA